MMDQDSDFRTHEELRDLLERIGLKLHAKNRVSGGEVALVWHIAETIRAAGRLAIRSKSGPELEDRLGNRFDRGETVKNRELGQFLLLLREEIENQQ
jgi:hypothetical protein